MSTLGAMGSLLSPMAASMPSVNIVDLNVIHRLTNLNDINRLLHETVAKERAIDVELDRLLHKRADLERNFLLLSNPTVETLELVHVDCEQLLQNVQGTAQVAEKISSKVRLLDSVQSRVATTLNNINLVLDRTNCINGVQGAMDKEDYESAAEYIRTFLDLESRLSSSLAGPELGQAEDQRQMLLDAKVKLEALVDKRLEEAITRMDASNVLRFAKLYKPLGKHNVGLKRLVEYLRLVVSGKARSEYNTMSDMMDARKQVNVVAVLSSLLREVALVLEDHEALVRDTFGAEALLEVVAGLQLECDVHGTKILQRYQELKKTDKLVKELANRKKGTFGMPAASSGGGGADTLLDPKRCEAVISELVLMCQRAEEYNGFMLTKMKDAVAPEPLSHVRETSFRSGQFNVMVREMLGQYMALEEYYMDETCAMALRIDAQVSEGLTSSMVDDVFFILRKCSMRALATGNVQCMCALLAELNNLLANLYRSALQQRLGAGPAKLLTLAPQAAGDAGTGPTPLAAGASDYATALNNSDVSGEYTLKLKAELERLSGDMFSGSADRERVKSVMQDLAKTSSDFNGLTVRGLESLSDALLGRLRPALDEVGQVNYAGGEEVFGSGDGGLEERWVGRLVAAFDASLSWLITLLTHNNYEALFHVSLDKVVAKLEVVLGRKPFSQLGGLQLDRDVRSLVGLLGEMTSRTVRDKFARLNQMALVLGLENVEELLDYWGQESGHITWRLSPAEVRSVLSQRTDFAKEAIMSLPL